MTAPLSGTGKERGYKGVQAVRLGSVAGGGCYGVMEFGMSCGITPKRNICAFQMKEIGLNFEWSVER